MLVLFEGNQKSSSWPVLDIPELQEQGGNHPPVLGSA